MRAKLVAMLACPHDQGTLTSDGDELVCEEGHHFPVRDGVPRLVPERTSGDDQETTFETFSAKWSSVSPEEVRQRFDQQYAWYLERYGFADEDGLAEFLEGRDRILDAGTGLGGDAARFARLSDAEVVGMDLSISVEVAQREYGSAPNLGYVQGDILQLPFRPGQFDFVSSDQVIHHTPDPPRAFANLAQLLAPGGTLAVYVYKRKGMMRELADDEIREVTTRMSLDDAMEFSRDITELGRELSHLEATVTLEKGIPLLGIEPGEHDLQRLIYWHFLKCFWNDDFSENLNDLVNFDWYHPTHASRHTPAEVEGWCSEAGLEIDRLDASEAGLSVLAHVPG